MVSVEIDLVIADASDIETCRQNKKQLQQM
jgi:hypothetical protein